MDDVPVTDQALSSPARHVHPASLDSGGNAGSLSARIYLRLFSIDENHASFERHGFAAVDERARKHLELVGRWFIRGYLAGLAEPRLDLLAARLNETPGDFRGFAYEGAGTALTVLDTLIPTKRRLRAFLRGPGFAYAWILPIGYGWARMRLRRPPRRPPAVFDPLQGWTAIDGAGFHEGFNKPKRSFEWHQIPSFLSPQAAEVFDQGLGRSLWFVRGGDVEAITSAISGFPANRRGNLWGGLASAATYAGGVGDDLLAELREAAGEHLSEVAVGAAVAAKARLLGGNLTDHTERACLILCGAKPVEAARCADAALEGLALAGAASPYEAWRARMKDLLRSFR